MIFDVFVRNLIINPIPALKNGSSNATIVLLFHGEHRQRHCPDNARPKLGLIMYVFYTRDTCFVFFFLHSIPFIRLYILSMPLLLFLYLAIYSLCLRTHTLIFSLSLSFAASGPTQLFYINVLDLKEESYGIFQSALSPGTHVRRDIKGHRQMVINRTGRSTTPEAAYDSLGLLCIRQFADLIKEGCYSSLIQKKQTKESSTREYDMIQIHTYTKHS